MKCVWAGSLSVGLGLAAGFCQAEEIKWRPAAASKPALAQGSAAGMRVLQPEARSCPPPVTLGRPVPITPIDAGPRLPAIPDLQVTPASYHKPAPEPPRPVARGQGPDLSPPTLAPPPSPVAAGATDERYNCGVVTEPPAADRPLLGRAEELLGGGPVGTRCRFQSDHCFDNFISPVSNPFLFEDPRSLTEVRPIFLWQGTPSSNGVFRGGDIEFLGLQARVALTERLSLVMNKLGLVWIEPHNEGGEFHDHVGFSELWIGPKYTFLRCEQTGTLAAAGLTFQIPSGSAKVFQDTGTLSLEPYVSFGQNFGRSSFGSFNFLNTTGYAFALDNNRTDYFFSNFHLDYDVAGLHRIYPLFEFNWSHYTEAGNVRNLGFEGRDLFNFGSMAVSGNDIFTMAAGARYKFSEALQAGVAFEWPLGGHRDLIDYRLTLDFIFRY